MIKFLRPVALLIIMALFLAGCSGGPPGRSSGGKIRVCATTYPLYDFAKNIGGDRIEAFMLLPPGAEPHHWEPAPGDIIKISGSDVLVYNGAGLESWLENTLIQVDRNKTAVVDSSSGVDLIRGEDGEQGQDPHIWLDPVNAQKMVDNILEGLVKADPANKDYYAANAREYKARLAELDGRYRAALSGAGIRQIVVSHDAFGYLARRYGLEQISARGLSADSEPSPARLAEIVELVREHHIKYIFYETLVSPKVSETIAEEAGVGTLVLNPVAGLSEEEMAGGEDYLKIMGENLENLKAACEAR
ncbi:MAG: metal ABC transporter substrate-binding protein [Actinobacteria bacterium]|nr:metal ABC transporter substrate-binding protein [Actinomycetota bacterium]